MFYLVSTTEGVFEVPGDVWEDDCIHVGNTYTPENCLWWDDIVDGLQEYVPGSGEFLQVEVKE